jgi:hypothetical protein
MRSPHHSTNPPVSPLDNAFAPAYLARLREQDESLTAAEAELAGPLAPRYGGGRPSRFVRSPAPWPSCGNGRT